jgi:probable F420-dependent oxidoreductase
VDLGRVGLWTSRFGVASRDELHELATTADECGFSSIWVPESTWADPFLIAALVLSTTARIEVFSGVARIHGRQPQTMTNAWGALSAWFPGRFTLGLGVAHEASVERMGASYGNPLESMRRYLERLDTARYHGYDGRPRRRVLAALGPKMLRLAGEKAAGAHSYNVPVEHTAFARSVLGAGPLLVPEVKVLFETDPDRARAVIREQVGPSLTLPNYAGNLVRVGYPPEDVAERADGVLDALVAWGDEGSIVERIRAHLDAGADQVAVQVLDRGGESTSAAWQRLADALA